MDPLDMGRAYCFAQDGAEFLGEAICPEFSGIDPKVADAEAKAMQRAYVEERVAPIRAEAKRIAKGPALIERVLRQAAKDAPNVVSLPRREERHTTAQIEAAIDAMGERINPSRPLTPAEQAAHRRLIADMEAEEAAEVERTFTAAYERRLAELEQKRTAHLPKDDKIVALPETAKERYRRAVKLRRALDRSAVTGQPLDDGYDLVWLGRYEASAEFRSQRDMHEDFGEAYLEQ
jgi:putative transposase